MRMLGLPTQPLDQVSSRGSFVEAQKKEPRGSFFFPTVLWKEAFSLDLFNVCFSLATSPFLSPWPLYRFFLRLHMDRVAIAPLFAQLS